MWSLQVWKQRQRPKHDGGTIHDHPSGHLLQLSLWCCALQLSLTFDLPVDILYFLLAAWGSALRPDEKCLPTTQRAELSFIYFLAVSKRRWQPWGSYEELQLLLLLLIIPTMMATVHKLWAISNYLLTTRSPILTAQRANSGPASTQTQNTVLFNTNKQRRVH